MSHRLLLVEDDPELREITARRFQRRGYEVTVAADGISALEVLRTATIDVAVIDHSLPDTDGVSLLRRLQAHSAELVGIIISGHADEHYRLEAKRGGAHSYLTKPCSLQALEETIQAALSSTSPPVS